jgi:hypothetical protein
MIEDKYRDSGRIAAEAEISEFSSGAIRAKWKTRIRSNFVSQCANPTCRSSWLQLWRGRSAPVFENGWTCSAACTLSRMRAALRRELDDRRSNCEAHRHRIPLGLLMLEQGWITPQQLRRALDEQRAAGSGRLGEWLVRHRAVTETQVTRALAMQWSCPVLESDGRDPSSMTVTLPRLFIDAYGALPLRLASERVFYLGFEQSLDRVVARGAERMLGRRVECCIVPTSAFRINHRRMLEAVFPPVELIEAATESAAACALARSLEKARPLASRLVRVHDCLWLRLWMRHSQGVLPEREDVRDVICSIDAAR